MIHHNESPTELESLLEALCEDRMSAEQVARLEQLILSSSEARWHYVTYLDLHGTLFWDAAGAGSSEPLSSQEIPVFRSTVEIAVPMSLAPVTAKRRRSPQLIAAISACLVLVVAGVWHVSKPSNQPITVIPRQSPEVRDDSTSQSIVHSHGPRLHGPPIALNATGNSVREKIDEEQTSIPQLPEQLTSSAPSISSRGVVARINESIHSRWTELGIRPSQRADDSEWLRRVSLDLIGRVPTVVEAEKFLANRSVKKREDLIDQLLDDTAFARNLTTKWTNLLIGRVSHPQVDRAAFQLFLRQSFAGNRPWNQIVAELISAEGGSTENGATNFLIAHLNNDATPATAVASKLFLGRQVQCNQCHNNPFDETKQLAFWEMNSFFQQTKAISRERRDPKTGRPIHIYTELVTLDSGGPTYFETGNGLMRVAYPRFNEHEIDPGSETNRRRELARLMTYGDQPQLAAAFVNRMWEHFFGSGFTRVVDDLGPHQPASHPELLGAISDQFIRSGYDVKQLVRWICQSDPYHLTSRFSDSNHSDDPSLGDLPAFSRMYVRSMTAEQTYDSFITATKANYVGAGDWVQAERNRQEWLQQFVISYDTDDNEESMTFEGTIGNALSLMNGPLIEKALDISTGSFLGEVVRQKSPDDKKIQTLCLAALSRLPEKSELSAMKKLVHNASSSRGSSSSRDDRSHPNEAYQDLFWALLNSNEFVMVR